MLDFRSEEREREREERVIIEVVLNNNLLQFQSLQKVLNQHNTSPLSMYNTRTHL